MPKETNGKPSDIAYVVEWHTFNKDGIESRDTVDDSQPKPSNVAEHMYMIVPNLNAAQRYYFKVRKLRCNSELLISTSATFHNYKVHVANK